MRGLINSSSGSVIRSTSLVNSGKTSILSLLSSVSNAHYSSWILDDSGATDHMTPISIMFLNYKACITEQHIQTIDGTLLPLAGIGSIQLPPIGLLTRMLHYPKLFVSLVSLQRIAKLDEHKILFDGLDGFV